MRISPANHAVYNHKCTTIIGQGYTLQFAAGSANNSTSIPGACHIIIEIFNITENEE